MTYRSRSSRTLTSRTSALLLAVALITGCDASSTPDGGSPPVDGGARADGAPDPGDGGSPPDAGEADALASFEDTVATAWCGALFRCCAEADLEEVFAVYRVIPGLPSAFAAFQDRLPPDATLTEESCVTLMRDLNAVAPFGQWLVEARAGRVGFDEDAYQACLDELGTAACGRPLEEALNDPACFALRDNIASAPVSGALTRAFFERTGALGEACTALEDDDAVNGTCDPSAGFCCGRASPEEDCGAVGVGGAGTCVAVGGEGDECSDFPPLPCGEGLRCRPGASISEPGRCEPAPTETAGIGEVCAEAFVTTAPCEEGFCDTSGDPGRCAARRDDGEACDSDDQCASFHCAGDFGSRTCAPFALCTEGGA